MVEMRKLDKYDVLSVRDGHSYAKRIVSVLTKSVVAFRRKN